MKKKAVKISGLMTSILSFLVFVSLLVVLLAILGLDFLSGVFGNSVISNLGYFVLILPVESTLRTYLGFEWEALGTILVVLGILLSLMMFVWGIKEMTLARKNDENFARCKKTCAFMMIVKFLAFLYPLIVILLYFIIGEISFVLQLIGGLIGSVYIPLIILIFLTVVGFINFIIPVITFSKAAKFLKENENQGFFDQNIQNEPLNLGVNENQNQQNFNEAPIYQAPYYNNPQSQPIEANTLFQPENEYEGDYIRIIPGRDGVPHNITEKGINDLMRLERLRASGTIDERNYVVMKEKICSTNTY